MLKMRLALLAGLLAGLPMAAVAQSPNAVTIMIPGKGMYVTNSRDSVGTFVPNVEFSSGDNCQVCGCCKKADPGMLREHLMKLGHRDLADDSQTLSKAMEIDVSKLPKR